MIKKKKKELLKKKCLLLASNCSNWPSQFCWSSWLQQAEWGLVSLFSLPDHTWPASSPISQQPPVPQVWVSTPPGASGVGWGGG